MEMVQFHPTTLYVAGATRALISEAVRGEGAYLVDREGRRFMAEYHAGQGAGPARRGQPGHSHRDGQAGRHLHVPRRAGT